MKKADLHIHTSFSDGTLSPEKVVELAKLNDLSIISITDHDTVAGVEMAAAAAAKLMDIKVIPGIEFSCVKNDESIHIIGYFIDIYNEKLKKFIENMNEARILRAKKIIEKLNKLGIEITLDEITPGSGSISRLHIADALVKKGIEKDTEKVFSKYLRRGKLAYVPKDERPSGEIIKLIREIGGIPVLAHPEKLGLDKYLKEFIDEGLLGIEVWYPGQNFTYWLKLARKYNLIPTGGSDSHGTRPNYPEIGKFSVEISVANELEAFKEELYHSY